MLMKRLAVFIPVCSLIGQTDGLTRFEFFATDTSIGKSMERKKKWHLNREIENFGETSFLQTA